MSLPIWAIDISATNQDGLYADRLGLLKADNPRFTRAQVAGREILLMRLSADGLFEPIDITGGVLAVAIGLIDRPPTSGTFSLAFDGDDTGLTDLPFNISEAALSAALNGNPAITLAGGVTVEKIGNAFFITFVENGAQPTLASDTELLKPKSYAAIAASPAGDDDTQAIQTLELLQRPYASTPASGWTNTATGSVNVTQSQVGSAGTKASWYVDYSAKPIGGSLLLEWETPAIWKLVFGKVNDYTPEIRALAFPTGGAVEDFAGQYFDVYLVTGGTRRVWWNLDGGTSEPAAPAGGSNIEVTYATGDNLGVLIQATITAMATDSTAFASVSNPIGADTPILGGYRVGLIYTLADAGRVPIPDFYETGITSSVLAGETGLGVQAGKDGIGGATVKIRDAAGIYAFYATSGTTTQPVVSIEDCNRSKAIAVAEGDDDSDIADLFQAAILAAGFGSTRSGSTVTVTSATNGALDAPTVTALGFFYGVTQQNGHNISVELPVTSSAGDIETATAGELTAVIATDTRWIITSATVGPQGDITADSASVRFAGTFTGELAFDTVALQQAFAGTTSTKIDATLEVKFTPAGGRADKVLQIPVALYRDLIRGDLVTTPAFSIPLTESTGAAVNFAVVGETGGGSTKLDGITTTGLSVPRILVTPLIAGGPVLWLLRAGTDDDTPGVVPPLDFDESDNAKLWQPIL